MEKPELTKRAEGRQCRFFPCFGRKKKKKKTRKVEENVGHTRQFLLPGIESDSQHAHTNADAIIKSRRLLILQESLRWGSIMQFCLSLCARAKEASSGSYRACRSSAVRSSSSRHTRCNDLRALAAGWNTSGGQDTWKKGVWEKTRHRDPRTKGRHRAGLLRESQHLLQLTTYQNLLSSGYKLQSGANKPLCFI